MPVGHLPLRSVGRLSGGLITLSITDGGNEHHAVLGLDEFSHIWLFVSPRATPAVLLMRLASLDGVDGRTLSVTVLGDPLDDADVYDIKPYIPYDALPGDGLAAPPGAPAPTCCPLAVSDDAAPLLEPAGFIQSCFRERNGTPRQGLIAPAARGRLVLPAPLPGVAAGTHVWILFEFHANTDARVHLKVRPPRLGGESTGVFATRSPHRPNRIGLTCALALGWEPGAAAVLRLGSLDLVHGTPVYAVWPYDPRSHTVPRDAVRFGRWIFDSRISPFLATDTTVRCDGSDGSVVVSTPDDVSPDVVFTGAAMARLRDLADSADMLDFYHRDADGLRDIICQVLSGDPRSPHLRATHERHPAGQPKYFGFCADVLNVLCTWRETSILVHELEDWSDRYGSDRRAAGWGA